MKNKLRNRGIIAICYSLNAIHCFIGYIATLLNITCGDTSIVFLGIVLALMVPLAVFDDRAKMTGATAVWIAIVLHTVLDFCITILSACYFLMYLSILETILMIFVCWKTKKRKM